MASDENFEKLSLLYQESTRVASLFWEWRYKQMTVFFSGMAVVIALTSWIYEHDLGKFLAAPVAAGSILSLICAALEIRNRQILQDAYRVAGEIEDILRPGSGGVFQAIKAAHGEGGEPASNLTFSQVFFIAYSTAFFVLLGLAVLAFVNS